MRQQALQEAVQRAPEASGVDVPALRVFRVLGILKVLGF